MPFESESQRRWMYANKPEMAKKWEAHTPKGKDLPEKVKTAAFFDEIEKIAATVLMKQLTPAAKKFMERMTGAAGGEIRQVVSARRLRHALTGAGSPQLMTEMHGMGKLLSGGERQALRGSRQHFENVLKQQGKVYRGVPDLQQRLQSIGGHHGTITRTPAKIVSPGTVAHGPAAKRRLRQAVGTAPTQMQPIGTAPTIMAPALG